ncbi:MAG: ATP-dependent Clp protease proteolytic subunit [Planctomycetaceae bacterium]
MKNVIAPLLAANKSNVLTLHVLGLIGESEYPWGELTGRVDVKMVRKAVESSGTFSSIELLLNSSGGSAYEGLAIGNYLKTLGVPTKCLVIGLCASAANYIALACDRIEMPANAQWMLHNARLWPAGDIGVDDCDQIKGQIVATNESCVVTYVQRSNQTADKIRGMMKAETWLLGEQCKELGFVDEVTGQMTATAEVQLSAETQHVLKTYQHAPQNVMSLAAVVPPALKDQTMTDPTKPAAAVTSPNASAPTEPVPAPTSPALTSQTTPQAAGLTTITTSADVLAATAAGRDAERTRQTAIRSVFQSARVSTDQKFNEQLDKLTQEFCDSPTMTERDAKDRLLTVLQHRNQVPPAGTGTSPAPTQDSSDPYAGFKAEYAAAKDVYQKMGVKEDAYVRTRCVDQGVTPPAAAK